MICVVNWEVVEALVKAQRRKEPRDMKRSAWWTNSKIFTPKITGVTVNPVLRKFTDCIYEIYYQYLLNFVIRFITYIGRWRRLKTKSVLNTAIVLFFFLLFFSPASLFGVGGSRQARKMTLWRSSRDTPRLRELPELPSRAKCKVPTSQIFTVC